jgi:predicted phosphodiesterase
VDLLLHGHSHRMRNERVGRTRVVNPGALHRAAVRTVGIVELPALAVAFYEVRPEGARPLPVA